jgi:LmbE family N-acetylglucosaminyl deacetylase
MLNLDLRLPVGRKLRLLCLGAHADDIEIGAGGTVLTLLDAYPEAEICWVVFTGNRERRAEAEASANAFLTAAGERDIVLLDHRDGFLPYEAGGVKEAIEAIRRRFEPDVVLTHTRGDAHQDHRLIADLSWNTFRDHLILEYEVAKWDGDLTTPQFYVPLSSVVAERKVGLLLDHFGSQRGRDWFSRDNFLALMRLRGLECRARAGYAEGFHARKAILFG